MFARLSRAFAKIETREPKDAEKKKQETKQRTGRSSNQRSQAYQGCTDRVRKGKHLGRVTFSSSFLLPAILLSSCLRVSVSSLY
jgi:hypothetical protein